MKELKTLKDLDDWGDEENTLVSVFQLKAEAIKWVKVFNNLHTRDWIKHFFNITEEDLRGGEDA